MDSSDNVQKSLPGMDLGDLVQPKEKAPKAEPVTKNQAAQSPSQRPICATDSPQTALPTMRGSEVLKEEHILPKKQTETEILENKKLEKKAPPHESLEGWQVFVLDAFNLIFQVFHAIPEMTSGKGEPVNAIYGFVRDILLIIEQYQPDAIICAFDMPGPTFRHTLFEEYKAGRSEMPEDLVPQIDQIRELVEALGIPVLGDTRFEADDVMATIARMSEELGAECTLVTGDKDCRQLITDKVSILNLRKNKIYKAADLKEDWGIRPDQVVDFQALVGDKVDNVPGVPLIGPKIACELITEYNTLENVLNNAANVRGKKRSQNLSDFKEQALLSQKLVRLSAEVPLTLDWKKAQVGDFDHTLLNELFDNYSFRSFGQRFEALSHQFSESPELTTNVWETEYETIDTEQKLAEFVARIAGETVLSIDTETTSVSPRFAEIVGYAIAWAPQKSVYIPVRGPAGDTFLDPVKTAEVLRPLLEDPTIKKVGQNLKYDMIVLRGAGIALQGISFDTMIASYLLDAGERNHNLDDLAKRYLRHETTKISELIGKGKNQKKMDEVSVAEVSHYAAEDSDIPLRLQPLLQTRLNKEELDDLFQQVELPLLNVLAEMEYKGIQVNIETLSKLSVEYKAKVAQLQEEIIQEAGHPFNIASPKQLATVLFEELNLPIVKKTKTGPSTDASVLEQLAAIHPLPAKIIEYRQFTKLLNTYVEALPEMVHPETGRIHASFNQVVAATGRLSSSEPNLQNIPVRTKEGRDIRGAFTAGPKGWKLLCADYSQIELRVLAHFCGDEALCHAFENDQDIHTRVAAEVFGVALDEVDAAMRRQAKGVNFGVIYGQSPFGLAKSLDISNEEAAQFIDRYFTQYKGVVDFMAETLVSCRRDGFVTTILGRRRAVQGVRAIEKLTRPEGQPGLKQLTMPERTAVNTVIQGSAADLIKLAMLRVTRRLRDSGLQAHMLLQIHDELVFETPAEEVDALARLVQEEMEKAYVLNVPLKVDVKYGSNWAECEPWDK